MELDDIFFVGKRPTTLRLVLGLMEDADSSLETYRWATPALLHSIHTKDDQLSKYVEDVFEQKGLIPYKPLPLVGCVPHLCRPSGMRHQGESIQGIHRVDDGSEI